MLTCYAIAAAKLFLLGFEFEFECFLLCQLRLLFCRFYFLGSPLQISISISLSIRFPYPGLAKVGQKLRLLVGHIDALRLRLESPTQAVARSIPYRLRACEAVGQRCTSSRSRSSASSSSRYRRHSKGAWRDIVILRLPIRFLRPQREVERREKIIVIGF